MEYKEIECKNEKIISKAKEYMSTISDYEHNINHMYDVVYYTKELLESLDIEKNKEVCIISAYWHDVGRIKADEGHERISAEMLKKEMTLQGYDENLINQCYKAIEKHKWNMMPETVEGLILKDADKLAWIGKGRWESCLENGQKLDSIVELLPKLKSEILYFKESKKIYDRDIVNLIKLLYKNIK